VTTLTVVQNLEQKTTTISQYQIEDLLELIGEIKFYLDAFSAGVWDEDDEDGAQAADALSHLHKDVDELLRLLGRCYPEFAGLIHAKCEELMIESEQHRQEKAARLQKKKDFIAWLGEMADSGQMPKDIRGTSKQFLDHLSALPND
jgi:hypothetical protein